VHVCKERVCARVHLSVHVWGGVVMGRGLTSFERVCKYMCMCMCRCRCICMCICICICVHMHMLIHYVHVYMYVYAYVYVCMCARFEIYVEI